jgi:flagellar M-ring protein FliF
MQAERQQRLEKELSTRVVALLEPVVGIDRVRVNVAARLNMNTEEQTEERFDPSTVIRSRQVTMDGSSNGASQGLAGARGNLPGPAPPTPTGTASTASQPPAATVASTTAQRSAEIVNYEVSKTVTHKVKPRGDISRLSVAVILDDEHTSTTDAQGKVTHKSAPRNAAELQKIQQIVAAAVGYDQARGDLLTVENIAFDEHVVEVVEPGFMERYGTDVKNTGKWIGVFLMCAMVLMFVIRPIVRDTLKSLPAARPTELHAAQGLPGQLPRTIEEVEGEIEAQLDAAVAARVADRKMPVLQRRVLTMAQGEPQNAARLMRSWLSEGGRNT